MTVSQLFNSQTKTIAFAAGLLVAASLVSRVLGIMRNALLSWQFGAGETTDIYLAAFRIPDFLYGILIMGGIGAVFLPVFSELYSKDEKGAWEFVSNLLHILMVSILFFSAIAFLAAPLLIDLVAPGFTEEQQEVTVGLTRLMLLSPILLGISAIFSGMLQYFGKFLAYSLAPLLYNAGIIFGILFLVPFFGIWGLGLGVVGGAFLHLAIQIPAALASGFRWRPIFNWKSKTIAKVLRLAFPRTIAAAGVHINLIVVTALASLISTGSITLFNYANDIQYFPIGLVGISFAIAAYPALSRFFVEKDMKQFQRAFAVTFRQIIFLVMPISIFMFLLRAQVVRLVYGAGDKFTWNDTRLTAAVLGIFAFGILFQALIPFLARVFFSMQDTKTPTFISVGSMGLNIVLAFVLFSVLSSSNVITNAVVAGLKLQGIADVRIIALPLALVLSGIFQAQFLSLFLRKHMREILQKELYLSLIKTSIASGMLAVVTYGILRVYGGVFRLTTYEEVLGQFVLASLGGTIAYIVTALFIKSPEMIYFRERIYARLAKRK